MRVHFVNSTKSSVVDFELKPGVDKDAVLRAIKDIVTNPTIVINGPNQVWFRQDIDDFVTSTLACTQDQQQSIKQAFYAQVIGLVYASVVQVAHGILVDYQPFCSILV